MPNCIALGTKDSGSGGFDDYGGELEIHRLDFADRSSKSVVAGAVSMTRSSEPFSFPADTPSWVASVAGVCGVRPLSPTGDTWTMEGFFVRRHPARRARAGGH